ncbi:hypothetical protein [Bacillus sp. FJAT-42315]|uniref:hypothetical protein n=1 Tax=Bacillus sp. FJAT-42315 TaxID=2014077 RepID=UPI000C24D7B1|nr:hypothetical protein [Bacillus sp. FJAT-42315]
MIYQLLVYIHIFSVILSVGPFFVLFPLLKKLRQATTETEQACIEVFQSAIRLVKHAGHVLVGSGILLMFIGSWPWTTSWVVMTIAVMVSSIFFLARAFTPTLKQFNKPSAKKQMLIDKLYRSVWIYITLLMMMLWFMVVKPVLW